MENKDSRSLDILGVKPVGDSIKIATQGAVDGAEAFLSRICLPAAEEFGLALRDRVSAWRAANMVAIVKSAEEKLLQQPEAEVLHAPPKIVHEIVDSGSWIDDAIVQDMWAGLLASSCSESGDDDSNLLFVTLMSQITKLQARVLNWGCNAIPKKLLLNGLLFSDLDCANSPIHADERYSLSKEQLIELTGESDIHRLDRELDHLREIGLLDGLSGFAFDLPELRAIVIPSPLAMQMYARCQGSRISAAEFFDLNPVNANAAAPYDPK